MEKNLTDESMHMLTAEILGALGVAATATKLHQGFLGAIFGAIAKFIVSEVEDEKREEFLRRMNDDLLRMIDHYSSLYGMAKEMADSLKEIVAKVASDDDSKPVH